MCLERWGLCYSLARRRLSGRLFFTRINLLLEHGLLSSQAMTPLSFSTSKVSSASNSIIVAIARRANAGVRLGRHCGSCELGFRLNSYDALFY